MPETRMPEARLPLTPKSENKYRLVGATLIDGTGAEPVRNSEIAVENGSITYVGPRRQNDDSKQGDDTIVDLSGKYILPGFIDTHVHLSMPNEVSPAVMAARFETHDHLVAAATIKDTLFAGITTARDLGGLDAGYRNAIADGTIVGPRLHLAVAVISPTGGHVDMHLPNGQPSSTKKAGMSCIADSDDEIREAVRRLIRSGADVIKICTTGGVSSPTDTPHDLGVPEHQVKIIVEDTARRTGQPVAAHAQGTAGILEAIRGGVSSIEHGYEIDEAGIELMKEKGTFLVPTLSSALRVPDPDKVPDYLYKKKVEWSAIAREHLTAALTSGVKVALGTDSAICPHGQNLKELGHMVDLGMSPMDAIVAGTKNAATLMRLEKHLGTLENGKLADLVITEVDPLSQIHELAKPDTIGVVMQGGNVMKDLNDWINAE